ncbi:hypothetical protein [Natrinema halophilum]|uniref:hypothetical protein n=1 Tax=Natrinema halophilum TaxID=1699371 RepID=UPI003CCDA3FF
MDSDVKLHRDITVDVNNVGGIDQAAVEFSPGVTVLAGRHATNRTSFLNGIMATLGSDNASIKADVESDARLSTRVIALSV